MKPVKASISPVVEKEVSRIIGRLLAHGDIRLEITIRAIDTERNLAEVAEEEDREDTGETYGFGIFD